MFQFAIYPILIIFAIGAPTYYSLGIQNIKQNESEIEKVQTQTRFLNQDLPTQNKASLVRDFNPSRGPKEAKITVVIFIDFQCPACRAALPTEDQISQKYSGQVRFVYKMFPLENIHPYAESAAKSALAAGKQGKYFQYASLLFSKQNDPAITPAIQEQIAQEIGLDTDKWKLDRVSAQINNAVDLDISGGRNAKIPNQKNPAQIESVDSTPTFVFMNGDQILFKTNQLTVAEFSQKLDNLLK